MVDIFEGFYFITPTKIKLSEIKMHNSSQYYWDTKDTKILRTFKNSI